MYMCAFSGEESPEIYHLLKGGLWAAEAPGPKGFFLLLQALLISSSLRNIIFLINTPYLLTNDFKEIILFLQLLGQILLNSRHKE